MKSMPLGDLRFTAIEDLCLVRRSFIGGGGFEASVEWVRFGTARSIRRTEAPLSARRRPANGPVMYASVYRIWRRLKNAKVPYQEQVPRTLVLECQSREVALSLCIAFKAVVVVLLDF